MHTDWQAGEFAWNSIHGNGSGSEEHFFTALAAGNFLTSAAKPLGESDRARCHVCGEGRGHASWGEKKLTQIPFGRQERVSHAAVPCPSQTARIYFHPIPKDEKTAEMFPLGGNILAKW